MRCIYCYRPHDAPTRACDPCLEKRRNHLRELYDDRTNAGLCVRCGKPAYVRTLADGTFKVQIHCAAHRSEAARYRKPRGGKNGRPYDARCDLYMTLFREGKTYQEICALMKKSASAVLGCLRRRGVEPIARAA